QIDELRPGGLIGGVAQADEQAGTGGRDLGHWSSQQFAFFPVPERSENLTRRQVFFAGRKAGQCFIIAPTERKWQEKGSLQSRCACNSGMSSAVMGGNRSPFGWDT